MSRKDQRSSIRRQTPSKNVLGHRGAPVWGEGTFFWPYMRMEIGTKLDVPKVGTVEANQPFSVGTWLRPNQRPLEYKDEEKPAGVILSAADAGQKQQGWQLRVTKGKLGFILAHEFPDNSIQVETKQRVLAEGRWNHVLATYDGSGKAAGISLYVDGRPQELAVVRDALQGSTHTSAPLEFGRMYPDGDPLRQSAYQDFRFFQRVLSADEAARLPVEDYVAEIVLKPMSDWSEDEFHAVSEFYFAQRDEPTKKLNAQIAPLNEELDRLSKDGDLSR